MFTCQQKPTKCEMLHKIPLRNKVFYWLLFGLQQKDSRDLLKLTTLFKNVHFSKVAFLEYVDSN